MTNLEATVKAMREAGKSELEIAITIDGLLATDGFTDLKNLMLARNYGMIKDVVQ